MLPSRFRIAVALGLLGFVFALFRKLEPLENLLVWPVPDDAFYYMKIAYNHSLGMGSTFDGVNPTNGYHPLWYLICLVWYSISNVDLLTSVYALILMQCLLFSATIFLLFLFACEMYASKYCAALFCLFITLSLGDTIVNLVETPVVVLFVVLSIVLLTSAFVDLAARQVDWKRAVILSVVLGLSVLSRLDSVALVAAASIVCIFQSRSLRVTAQFMLPCGIIILAYFTLNYVVFGVVSPVSGATKRIWSDQVLSSLVWSEYLREKLRLFFSPNYHVFTAKPFVQGFIGIGIVLCAIRILQTRAPLQTTGVAFALSVGYVTLKYALYVALYHGIYMTSYWYWVTDLVLISFWLWFFIAKVILLCSDSFGRVKYVSYAIAGSCFVILLLPQIKDIEKTVSERMHRAEASRQPRGFLLFDLALFVREPFFDERRIGSWNAGLIGYFSHHQVVNLDGLVNAPSFLLAIRENRVPEYIRDNLDVVVDYMPQLRDQAREAGFVVFDIREIFWRDPRMANRSKEYYGVPAEVFAAVRPALAADFAEFLERRKVRISKIN